MHLHHQVPSKTYYLDRLGNMSTNNTNTNTSSMSSGGSTSSSASSGATSVVRKQILPLKPRQPNSFVQHLDMKAKDVPNVPVTMLELKRKDKTDKNVVTTLIYRKPSTVSSAGSLSDHHHHHQHLHQRHLLAASQGTRSGSPSSSGYDTDSLVDQENCDVFSSLLTNVLNEQLDMLHSHPIWSPQPQLNNNNNNNSLLMSNQNGSSYHHHHQSNMSMNNNNNLLLNQNDLMAGSSPHHHHHHNQYLYFSGESDKFLVQ